jgi:hypothetical protein
MLYGIIRIIQHRADRANILSLGKHQHLFDPIGRNNLNIIVQQQEITALCVFDAIVIDRGIIKLTLIGNNSDVLFLFQR